MSIVLASPVAGLAVTGFTAPTFTLAQDLSAPVGSLRYVVVTRGGTQGGGLGEVHTLNSPFTVEFRKPTVLRTISKTLAEAVGLYTSTKGNNEYYVLARKSERVNSVGGRAVNYYKGLWSICPETASQAAGYDDIRGLQSFVGGLYSSANFMNGLTDTFVSGNL